MMKKMIYILNLNHFDFSNTRRRRVPLNGKSGMSINKSILDYAFQVISATSANNQTPVIGRSVRNVSLDRNFGHFSHCLYVPSGTHGSEENVDAWTE